MGIIKSLKAWKQDRRMVSMEKHEIDYIKKLAKKFLRETDGQPEHAKRMVRVSSLQRMCKYILKTKPETRKHDQ